MYQNQNRMVNCSVGVWWALRDETSLNMLCLCQRWGTIFILFSAGQSFSFALASYTLPRCLLCVISVMRARCTTDFCFDIFCVLLLFYSYRRTLCYSRCPLCEYTTTNGGIANVNMSLCISITKMYSSVALWSHNSETKRDVKYYNKQRPILNFDKMPILFFVHHTTK